MKKEYEKPAFCVRFLFEDDVITASDPTDSWTEDREDWYNPNLPSIG